MITYSLLPHTLTPFVGPLAEREPWHNRVLGIRAAQRSSLGKGDRIAVFDTGCDRDHPDLAGQIDDFEDYTGSPVKAYDRHGHGTWCAGVIGAIVGNNIGIPGIAPAARLGIFKCLGDSGSGSDLGIARAIDAARERGYRKGTASLGSSQPSPLIHAAIQRFVAADGNRGRFFAAAGNDGRRTGYPAAHPEVFSIAAMDENGRPAGFTSPGKVEFIGPGVNCLSLAPRGGLATMSGTSMACPIICAVSSLIDGEFYEQKIEPVTWPQLLILMRGAAIDVGRVGPDPTAGYGIVDAQIAMLTLHPKPDPITEE